MHRFTRARCAGSRNSYGVGRPNDVGAEDTKAIGRKINACRTRSLWNANIMSHIIYHITTQPEWLRAKQQGFYEAASLPVAGFIHCSTAEQVEGVLQRYFKNKGPLVKLTIDSDKLHARLQHDLSVSLNQHFPHIYGRLNLDAVIEEEPISQ